jgi:hypothetical protein
MGTRRDARFECGCGAIAVYTADCPREATGKPRCVCGQEMQPIAESHGVPAV